MISGEERAATPAQSCEGEKKERRRSIFLVGKG